MSIPNTIIINASLNKKSVLYDDTSYRPSLIFFIYMTDWYTSEGQLT